VTVVVVGLLVVPAASGQYLGWNETATIDHTKAMRYRVQSLTLTKSTWKASISFQNLTKQPLGVARGFGIAFYADPKTQALAKAVGFLPVNRYSKPLPKTLAPGATWTGVVSGIGSLTTTQVVYARVIFGPFTGLPSEKTAQVWITNHNLPVGQPSGPVI
jgi:hypothetical protein